MRYPPASKEQLTAPQSRFRVIGVNVADASGTSYQLGDFDTLDAAQSAAGQRAGVGSPTYVYNDAGELLVRLGSWH
jgi:hypothetical protein